MTARRPPILRWDRLLAPWHGPYWPTCEKCGRAAYIGHDGEKTRYQCDTHLTPDVWPSWVPGERRA